VSSSIVKFKVFCVVYGCSLFYFATISQVIGWEGKFLGRRKIAEYCGAMLYASVHKYLWVTDIR